MCSEQFRGAAFPLNCSCATISEPFWSLQSAMNSGVVMGWLTTQGELRPPALAFAQLHTVVQSHHLWLGCCVLCLLSGIARLLLQVLCQVLDAGPLRALARLSSRALWSCRRLCSAASVLGLVGLLPRWQCCQRAMIRNPSTNSAQDTKQHDNGKQHINSVLKFKSCNLTKLSGAVTGFGNFISIYRANRASFRLYRHILLMV
jgi:hypothetical protein